MEGMTPERIAALKQMVEEAQQVRKILKEKGWEIVKDKIDARITDEHKIWLKAKSPESAEIIRLKTAGYEGIFDIIKKILLEGENAQQILSKNPNINWDNS